VIVEESNGQFSRGNDTYAVVLNPPPCVKHTLHAVTDLLRWVVFSCWYAKQKRFPTSSLHKRGESDHDWNRTCVNEPTGCIHNLPHIPFVLSPLLAVLACWEPTLSLFDEQCVQRWNVCSDLCKLFVLVAKSFEHSGKVCQSFVHLATVVSGTFARIFRSNVCTNRQGK
jgi:hypothetical protein